MEKIRLLQSSRISIDGGRAEIIIEESLDGLYSIELIEYSDNFLRLGFRESHGTEFKFLKSWKGVK